MPSFRILIVTVIAAALVLGACGRRGPLEPPPSAADVAPSQGVEKEARDDRSFPLDFLIE